MSAQNINVSIENTINYVATGNVKATVKIAEYGVGDNTTMSARTGDLPTVETLKVEIEGTEQNNAPEENPTYHEKGQPKYWRSGVILQPTAHNRLCIITQFR